ncbi:MULTISPECIES: sigma-54-dependent Fis family transcriptional regulator [Cytobacillus]|uniref:Sigma-54-dependent Fis family transcriptional regulator n=1 Tax=Cytobacillus oceanisediminis 2691 TaxID=1196031 RepID=A0A160MFK0_9BACI|nr:MULTISPECIES: sigma-54-dependent Fis family transcriptional regulator [Cytobacillus]MCS0823770.1 sigma-54-dependent Fis family transcriptional regulator [Cytobacillus firmus]AND41368.1 sigma-54-dependent Fis family transcriptional regulator [Cytobacillus oceanisediminis 2691]MCM3242176.1 sigma-54-dependent Fis family transcriptional regulator [Cytobacillus oceanisediminis]MCM3404963.1 sigma-54-dependent Fis family transcriptional regulator [Cytobacillus oceanisediminis]MDK7664450.1 sigma 54
MQTVMIVGAGKGGTAILKIIKETAVLDVKAMVDINPGAEGLRIAKESGIPIGTDWRYFMDQDIDIIIEVTGNEQVFIDIREARSKNTVLIPGSVAFLIAKLLEEKEELISKFRNETYKHDLIFNSTDDGMIVINNFSEITVFNRSAERMTGIKRKDALGKKINEVITDSMLPRVMATRRIEANQEMTLANGLKIITTRIPMLGENNELMGAFAVFKDITEVVSLAEEITNLKEIQTMLQAIIQSSEEAISVVDENGKGILINPAYSRLTGLEEEKVIGKPATADISEGESVHMKVLQTRRAMRGVAMRVGPKRKDVIVNVAPVIVDGKLKGSVGVIHDVSEIQNLNRELSRARQIIRTLEAKYSFEDIIGSSEEMKLAIEQARLGAKTPATVLLRGESGTGKELFAHAIHNASDRKYNKFIRVNCAALSESLLESELFGYEEGAFSGAKRGGKRGLFEEADKGSIFLDEIGELTANTQAKLLRVLQEHEITRVGGTKPISIDVRVIAATNVNLEKGIADGTFREDLYYRLNRMPIHIPSLRRRKEDIPLLCSRLIQKINQEYGRNVEGVTEQAVNKLMAYDWPGNVRELDNILGRAIIFMNYNETDIEERHIPDLIGANKPSPSVETSEGAQTKTLTQLVEQYEAKMIRQTLHKLDGNKTKTAKSLGLSVRNLYYKLEKYDIAKDGMQ